MKIPCSIRERDNREAMSMTPMIDVVFLLLIFFVCASIGQTKELLLSTPLAAGSLATENPPTVPPEQRRDKVYLKLLRVGDQTVVDLDGRQMTEWATVRNLLVELARLDPNIPVIIDTADQVPLGDMIGLYDVCRSADFEKIDFAISRPAPPVAK